MQMIARKSNYYSVVVKKNGYIKAAWRDSGKFGHLGSGLNWDWNCIGGKMIWFKEKNVSDAKAPARLFDAETGYFAPTPKGSAQFHQLVVEISSFTGSKLRQLRLNLSKSACCAVQIPNEYRPE